MNDSKSASQIVDINIYSNLILSAMFSNPVNVKTVIFAKDISQNS